ncbi:alpha/beta fold hydrolase [Streptomyces jumonjinensis]|uniref:Alpha/beta fold hydrolase n=2 Tax=Streptomyces TaxID=1883 RepID=A0A646KFD1_STRJU|nr:alpha/beta hydrolase [Streptomyces jumonjinensis]MQT00770.1 alpha/beta fold hydrolase [Streptomyces jumonjinensis]
MPKFTAYDGTELAYHLKGTGEPLICLPGGPARAAAYYGTLGGLDAHHRLVLLDLRGTGGSAEPADPATRHWYRQTDDIEALREHLGLDRVHLLAHSASGNLATLYAARHPARVRSLTLIAPGSRAGDDPDRDLADGHPDGAFDPAATRAALAVLQAPVLVLAAPYDGGPRPANAAELAGIFPYDAKADAHHPWLDDCGAFVRTVRAFLDPDILGLDADGVRLAYRTWGEESAPPVVLAHGRGDSGADWALIAERLAATRRVYAPDFGGHGLSDWPGEYGFEQFRNQLSAFIRGLGLDGVDVIGHSMGAVAAFLLAADEPELVDRLVIEEPPPPFPLDTPRPPARREEGELGFDWPVVLSIEAELNAPDPAWSERLAAIEAPTLVIAGGPGSHIPQERLARLAGRIPGARLITIEAGHLIHETRPEEFLAALKDFGI